MGSWHSDVHDCRLERGTLIFDFYGGLISDI